MNIKMLIVYVLLMTITSTITEAQYRIALSKENTYTAISTITSDSLYLIDIAVPRKKINLLIDNSKNLIPTKTIVKQRRRTPGWNNIDTLIVLEKSNIVYQHKHPHANHPNFTAYIVTGYDKVKILNNLKNEYLKYPLLANKQEHKDSTLIYYAEEYGPKCCPVDLLYPKIDIYTSIANFEKDEHVTIGHYFDRKLGEEGEHIVYLMLDGLNPQQKIKFINYRRYDLIVNKATKDIDLESVDIPFFVETKSLK